MQIHKIIDYPRLQKILNPIDDNLTSNIDKVDIRQFRLINSLIMLLIQLNPISKIQSCLQTNQPQRNTRNDKLNKQHIPFQDPDQYNLVKKN